MTIKLIPTKGGYFAQCKTREVIVHETKDFETAREALQDAIQFYDEAQNKAQKLKIKSK